MKISIKYSGREIYFEAGEIEGQGFDELVQILASHKDIDEVLIEGENGSYTSKRQVYLFANMLQHICGTKITLVDDGIMENGLAKVTYKQE